MKTTLTFFVLILIVSGSVLAQELPKTGAVLRASINEVSLIKGQTTEIELTLVRSKIERRTKFDLPEVQEIDGVHASVKQGETPDSYILVLTPTEVVGSQMLIVQGSGPNKRYMTGTMISLSVSQKDALALKND